MIDLVVRQGDSNPCQNPHMIEAYSVYVGAKNGDSCTVPLSTSRDTSDG